MDEEFDFEYGWVLSGELTTTRAQALADELMARFPVAAQDPERECQVTVNGTTLVVSLRYDSVIGSLVQDLVELAPDAKGMLELEWPYAEIREHVFPEDWRFDGNGQVNVYGYHLAPDTTAQHTYTALQHTGD